MNKPVFTGATTSAQRQLDTERYIKELFDAIQPLLSGGSVIPVGDNIPTVATYAALSALSVTKPTLVLVTNDESTGRIEVPYLKTQTQIRQLATFDN